MDKANLMVFAGQYLERYGKVTNINLQQYIHIQPEVEKNIAIEDIDVSLNLLTVAGFLEQIDAHGDGMIVYRRFIPKTRNHH